MGTATLQKSSNHAVVVVLGNIAQSPRMKNHAISLLENGYTVDMVCYNNEDNIVDLPAGFKILNVLRIKRIAPLPSFVQKLALLIINIVIRTLSLLWIGMFRLSKRPTLVLVQNPPSVPTMLVAPMIAFIYGSRYIIDWHNLGFSILALNFPPEGMVVRISQRFELWLAKLATEHLTVTKAMKDWLCVNGKLPSSHIHVLYDRPNREYKRLTLDEQHYFLEGLFAKLEDEYLGRESPLSYLNSEGKVCFLPDRPALVVSSTSWSADEDFDALIEAVKDCEERLYRLAPHKSGNYPRVFILITGKGPLRSAFEEKVSKLDLRYFRIKTLWLPLEDYHKLLDYTNFEGCADFGLCLHYSSSGLDLPMKVVDMFGCNLPVLSFRYPCIGELVVDGKNGLLFGSAPELADKIMVMIRGTPKNKRLQELHRNISETYMESWKMHWKDTMLPILSGGNHNVARKKQ